MLTTTTLLSITANHETLIAASSNLLGWRCLSGWIYGLLDGVYAGVKSLLQKRFGKIDEQLQIQQVNNSLALQVQALQEQIAEIKAAKPAKASVQTRKQAVPSAPVTSDTLALAEKFFEENPELLYDDTITANVDAQLADFLGLSRPASARFWRLKVRDMRQQSAGQEAVVDEMLTPEVTVEEAAVEAMSTPEVTVDEQQQQNQDNHIEDPEEEKHTDKVVSINKP